MSEEKKNTRQISLPAARQEVNYSDYADSLSSYLRKIDHYPPLSVPEQEQLCREIDDCMQTLRLQLYEFGTVQKEHIHLLDECISNNQNPADAFLLSLGYRHDREKHRYELVEPNEKRVALFAHQGFGMAFLSSILDIPYPMFCTHFNISHTSMSVIQFDETAGFSYPQAIQLSNDSHLYRDGLLTGYNNGIRV